LQKVVHAPKAIVYHKHLATLKGMAKQFRRYGFEEILLYAMYKDRPGYQRTLGWQFKRISSQVRALFTLCPVFRLLAASLQAAGEKGWCMS
jgi:hypothetical protein